MDKKITIVDFKRAFAGVFRFMPYPEWVKTTYDTGDQVNYNGQSYESLTDNNYTVPGAESSNWKVLEQTNPDLLNWIKPVAYSTGEKVLFLDETTWKWGVYDSKIDGNYDSPANTNSWNSTNDSIIGYVSDSMITEAFAEANTVLPKSGISEFDEYKQVFLLLSAHFLIMDWQAKNAGLNPSGTSGILTSKRISDFSATYALSPILTKYPEYSILTTTYWGQKALFLLSRHWVGNVVSVGGAFTPY